MKPTPQNRFNRQTEIDWDSSKYTSGLGIVKNSATAKAPHAGFGVSFGVIKARSETSSAISASA